MTIALTKTQSSGLRKTGKREGASHYSELLSKVKEANLLQREVKFYVWYFALVSALSLAAWAGIFLVGTFFHGQFAWQLLALPVVVIQGALTAQYAFIAHELAHNQVFAKNKWNDWAGLVMANLFAGLSYGFWLSKHNRHHAKPNMIDGDPDINLRVIAFTTEQKYAKPASERLFTRNQGWLFPVISFLTAGDLLMDSIKSVFRNEGRGANRRYLELSLLVVRFFVPAVLYFLFLNPILAAIAFLTYMAFFGFFLGNAFAVNHIGMPLVQKDSRIGFLERQVLTSRNIKPSWFIDLMMGGLNYQVEHHLFPSLARPQLKKARQLVIEFCKEKRIKYTEVSFSQGYASVIRHLNEVGTSTKIDPFICPLVSAYRQTP